MTPLRNPSRVLIAGLALGIVFDLFFNGKAPGVSLAIYAVLLVAALFVTLRWETVPSVRSNIWLPVAFLFFAAMGFVRANPSLVFMNVAVALILLALMAIYQTSRSVAELGLLSYVALPFQAPLMALLHGGSAIGQAFRSRAAESTPEKRRRWLPVLRGLLIAAPVVVVFMALLVSADLIFEELVRRALSVELLEMLGRWAGHVFLAILVGFLVAGGLAYAARKEAAANPAAQAVQSELSGISRLLGATEASIAINSVNLLFLAFVVVQVPYLFGGRLNITPAGFTYAEYARRGFGELVVVAVLTLGMTVVLSAVTRRETAQSRRAFNLSNTLLLTLTGVMLVSAFKRLWLYEVAFGFTRMRIYPQVFMVWLALLLAWSAFTLWRRPDRFAIGVAVAVLGFVFTLDILNPDAFIVYRNYQHQAERALSVASTGARVDAIDSDYLAELSADAVPALIWVSDHSTGETKAAIDEGLAERAAATSEDPSSRSWPSFHLARDRAYRLLEDR